LTEGKIEKAIFFKDWRQDWKSGQTFGGLVVFNPILINKNTSLIDKPHAHPKTTSHRHEPLFNDIGADWNHGQNVFERFSISSVLVA